MDAERIEKIRSLTPFEFVQILIKEFCGNKGRTFIFLVSHRSRVLYDPKVQDFFKDQIKEWGFAFLTKEEYIEINRKAGLPDEVSEELWKHLPLYPGLKKIDQAKAYEVLLKSARNLKNKLKKGTQKER